MNRKSKIIVSVLGIAIVTLALLGLTYAYYLTRIQGNTNTNSISVTTADLKLVYGDGNGAISASDIMPGTTITKTFTVTNAGKSTVEGYLVVLEDIKNDLTRKQDLTYTLECINDDNESCGKVENVIYPNEADFAMLFSNTIAVEEIHNYTLMVTYVNEPTIDQSDDMGSIISGRVNIKDANTINSTNVTNIQGTLAYDLYNNTTKTEVKSEVLDSDGYITATFKSNEVYYMSASYYYNDSGANLGSDITSGYSIDCADGDSTLYEAYQGDGSLKYTVFGTPAATSCDDAWETVYEIVEYVSYDSDNNLITLKLKPVASASKYIFASSEEETFQVNMLSKEDDYGNSYYFGETVDNKYVYFAGYYWKVVRINGDGSIRLVYDGEELLTGDEWYMRGISGMDNYNNILEGDTDLRKYVGYMYGTTEEPYKNINNSNIKTVVDEWYENNLKDNYSGYLSDTLFCNDREEVVSDDDTIYYAAADRFSGALTDTNAKLTCEQKQDRFTVEDEAIGNGDLSYPIGLLTFDEVSLIRRNLWQKDGQGGVTFFTMTSASPGYMLGIEEGIYYSNYLDVSYGGVASGAIVLPVINLKAGINYTIDENGVYVITTN